MSFTGIGAEVIRHHDPLVSRLLPSGHRRADFDCAREFIAEVEAERRPGKWALEQWKEAIR